MDCSGSKINLGELEKHLRRRYRNVSAGDGFQRILAKSSFRRNFSTPEIATESGSELVRRLPDTELPAQRYTKKGIDRLCGIPTFVAV